MKNITWHPEILSQSALALLPELAKIDRLEGFTLIGGTALSLYLGHRQSIDFDFIAPKSLPQNSYLEFKKLAPETFQLFQAQPGSVEFSIKGVKIFLWENYYPLTRDKAKFQQLTIANPIDIGLLKLLALQGRIAWKDIVDLYFIDQEVIPIQELLNLYQTSFSKEYEQLYVDLKLSLNFCELNKSIKPKMLKEVQFENILEELKQKFKSYLLTT